MEPPLQPPPPPAEPPPPPPGALAPDVAFLPPPPPENTSGQGKGSIPPGEVSGRWNWAAFLFPTVFAGINRLWLWLAIAATPVVLLGFDILPRQVSSLASLGVGIYLGIKGNGLAWQKRRWESVQQFRKVQRRWAWGSLVAIIALVALVAYATANGGPAVSDEPIAYDAHGITFEVPARWSFDPGGEFVTGLETMRAQALWLDVFYQGEGSGIIVVAPTDIGVEIHQKDLQEAANTFATSAGGSTRGEPETLSIDGRPAFRIYVATALPDGGRAESELVMVFEGTTGVVVKYQYTTEDETAVRQACDHIVDTFRISDPELVGSPSPQAT